MSFVVLGTGLLATFRLGTGFINKRLNLANKTRCDIMVTVIH